MLLLVYNFFLLFALGICQQDLSEKRNGTERNVKTLINEEPKDVSQPQESTAKTPLPPNHYNDNYHQRHKHTNTIQHYVDPRRQILPPSNGNVPIFGIFEEAEPINNDGGRYNIRLHHYRSRSPLDFNTALGAISAHIVGQKSEDEYIPYPPNGDPYNYPPYRGYPHATEPPVIRAYETSSNREFGSQSTANLNQYDAGIYQNNDYDFPNQYDNVGFNYYNDRNFFQGEGGGGGGFLARNNEPVEELRSLFQEREMRYGRPPTRVANL